MKKGIVTGILSMMALAGCYSATDAQVSNNAAAEVNATCCELKRVETVEAEMEQLRAEIAAMKSALAAQKMDESKSGLEDVKVALPEEEKEAAVLEEKVPVQLDERMKAVEASQDRAAQEGQYRTADEANTMQIFRDAAPGTVYVTQNQVVRDWRTARAMEVPVGEGSGFIWDKDGHIVTNYHVIDGAATLTVKLYNGKSYSARLVGGEPKKDVAVLKIDAPADELQPIKVPDSEYELSVGQKTIAIGNPFGLDHSLTTGIVSAIGRDKTGYGGVTIRDMIQTDASINPGNSGGPLLDSSGNLIGMNTMIATKTGESAGIGFAVPFMTISQAVEQIISFGHVQQIGLGISILDDRVAQRYGVRGVIIRAVSEGSPADKAGLKGLTTGARGTFIGDIIVGIDDKEITKYDDLYSALDRHQAGDKVDVKIRRGGSVLSIPVEVYVLP